jgi:hypothetical protein
MITHAHSSLALSIGGVRPNLGEVNRAVRAVIYPDKKYSRIELVEPSERAVRSERIVERRAGRDVRGAAAHCGECQRRMGAELRAGPRGQPLRENAYLVSANPFAISFSARTISVVCSVVLDGECGIDSVLSVKRRADYGSLRPDRLQQHIDDGVGPAFDLADGSHRRVYDDCIARGNSKP